MKFDIYFFSKKLCTKFKFHENITKGKGTLCEDLCAFITVPRLIILGIRHVSEKVVGKEIKLSLYRPRWAPMGPGD
jgi:hypothetical protein